MIKRACWEYMMNVVNVVVAAFFISMPGCSKSVTTAPPVSNLVIFRDRTDPRYEWVIIVRASETFLQRADFPGFSDRRWYLLRESPISDPLCTVGGDLKPPFVPGGPNLMRQTLTETGVLRDEAYFSDKSSELRRFLSALEDKAAKEAPLNELPPWIKAHSFLKPLLGM